MLRSIKIAYSECPYDHFSFRQHLKKQLNETEEKYPGTKQRILNSFLKMEKIMRKGLKDERSEIVHCERCGEPGSAKICMRCKMLGKLKTKLAG